MFRLQAEVVFPIAEITYGRRQGIIEVIALPLENPAGNADRFAHGIAMRQVDFQVLVPLESSPEIPDFLPRHSEVLDL